MNTESFDGIKLVRSKIPGVKRDAGGIGRTPQCPKVQHCWADFPHRGLVDRREGKPKIPVNRCRLTRGHSFVGELLDRLVGLVETIETHAAENVVGLGELDALIADNLDPIAPWVIEIEKPAGHDFDTHLIEHPSHGFLVVDHQPEMPVLITRSVFDLRQGDELIAKIDERHRVAFATKGELQNLAVEFEGLVDIANLEGNMVDAHGSGLFYLTHFVHLSPIVVTYTGKLRSR